MTLTDADGGLREDAFAALLRRQVEAGPDSVCVLGSTGGHAFLGHETHRQAVRVAVEAPGGSMPLIVGVSALRTDEAEVLARDAREAGANGVLLAPISYTPLTDAEAFQHFRAVAKAGGLPLCIYNNPSTTRFTFTAHLIARLSRLPNVAAVMMPLPPDGDFGGEVAALRAATPPGFAVGYSGDWGAADALLAGGDVWFSVVAGLLPVPALASTRVAEARRLNNAFGPLWALFREFGSFRVMHAMAEAQGLGSMEPPRPILPLGAEHHVRVVQALGTLNGLASS